MTQNKSTLKLIKLAWNVPVSGQKTRLGIELRPETLEKKFIGYNPH